VAVSYAGQERRVLVKPDSVFALKSLSAPPEQAYRHYLLELDRGTMPILRRDLWGSSVMRKWLGYSSSHYDGVHQRRFGARTARVPIVTTGPARLAAMVEAFAELAAPCRLPARLFLFADREGLLAAPDFLTAPWVDGAGHARSIYG
jgi:hypothetical protein